MRAVAYIDPGIIGNLGQVVYVAILGTVSFLIVRPWRFVRSIFSRRRRESSDESDVHV